MCSTVMIKLSSEEVVKGTFSKNLQHKRNESFCHKVAAF